MALQRKTFPLPRIDDTLDTLAEARWFSALYMRSDYWHLVLHPDDKENTAFSINQGLWQAMFIPSGLCNTSAMFEQLMETILRRLTSRALCTWTA
jgi:hypothetical protein